MTENEKKWLTRPYAASDKETCLRIFDSNTPPYFLPDEREKFSAYLETCPSDYLVAENDGKVIAGGGYLLETSEDGVATLCWGMVHQDFHGQGVGRHLLRNRLSILAGMPGIKTIRLEVSWHSVEFFLRKGFKTYRITRNYYGPTLNRYEMRMVLDEEKIKEINSSTD